MRPKITRSIVLCVGLSWAGHGLAQEQPIDIRSDRIFPPVAGQIGTSDIKERNGPGASPRVGVLAYCADIAPNAAALGLMAFQLNAQRHGHAEPNGGIVNGGWGRQGQFGAQNLVDMLMFDDDIPRFRDVVLVDGDREQPTGEDLLNNFDVVIAYTDRQCGVPIPGRIANQAAQALAEFARAGRGVVLTGFAFDAEIGFGDAIFRRGLSPFLKTAAGLDGRCSRPGLTDPVTGEPVGEGPCPIGSCAGMVSPNGGTCAARFPNPSPAFPNGNPAFAKECLDEEFARCTQPEPSAEFPNTDPTSTDPLFQPHPVTADLACDHMLSLVDGPTVSSWATALTEADVDRTATLCFNYDVGGQPLPFLAINQDRNVVALNTFPPDAHDISKFWYQCQIGNAIQYVGGNRSKCLDRGCNEVVNTLP